MTLDDDKTQTILGLLDAPEIDEGVLASIDSFGKDGLELLLAIAEGSVKGILMSQRKRAVYVLGVLGSHKAVHPLEQLLKEPDVSLRNHVLYAISRLSNEDARRVLLETLKGQEFGIAEKAHALNILRSVGDAETGKAIDEWADHADSVYLTELARGIAAELRRGKNIQLP